MFYRREMAWIVIDSTTVQIQDCGSGVKESLGRPSGQKLRTHNFSCRRSPARPEAAPTCFSCVAAEVCVLVFGPSHRRGGPGASARPPKRAEASAMKGQGIRLRRLCGVQTTDDDPDL